MKLKKNKVENREADQNNEELMLKVEHVYKRYRLGLIGGGTLSADLQSWWSRVRHKPDPKLKIGEKKHSKNEVFYALKDINFEVKKGEAVGIIGGNGAGKSTTLKLISQVTAPTEGKIYLNGRVTSMLEVGTGFHGELTGRENIYINGAILGMSKKEIDSKIEQIIDFSEVRQFIDTPVKRYSSGMYVKLAFSVAAHLDSEIVIMDEVLAVGDLNFQQKCIQKMRQIAHEEGRTVLYVSHNMSTIKALCDRCIVLNKGEVLFDGDVDRAIEIYSNKEKENISKSNDLRNAQRFSDFSIDITDIHMSYLNVLQIKNGKLIFDLFLNSKKIFTALVLRVVIRTPLGVAIGCCYSKPMNNVSVGINSYQIGMDVSCLVNGVYRADLVLSSIDSFSLKREDIVEKAFHFELVDNDDSPYNLKWQVASWGNIKINDCDVEKYDN